MAILSKKNNRPIPFDSVCSKEIASRSKEIGQSPKERSFARKWLAFFVSLLIIIGAPMAAYLFFQKARPSLLFQRFEVKKTLQEAGTMKNSSSLQWWLSSGGVMLEGADMFSTNLGSLAKNSFWQKLYAKTNARDTDGGFYPQNIFRLVNRTERKNLDQQVYFNIDKINLSSSGYRNESNGVFFFNRYQDQNNLYYTGLRVDGRAVIKKKINSEYYTMAEKPVFSGKYDRQSDPDLIPLHQWIGIRSEVENLDNGSVMIRFFVDPYDNGNWQLALEARDDGNKYGGAPITSAGYGGLRSDFMDVIFKDYSFQELKS